MDRRLLSSQLQNSSKRSLISVSESDGGSLLSGLSQARKIPNRRRIPEETNNGKKNNRNNGKLSRSAPRDNKDNGIPKAIRGSANNNNAAKREAMKQKNEVYKKEIDKIVKLQAFARCYIARFAYQSRLTMERTKQRFFAIQIQASVRGFLQRLRYWKLTNKKRPAKKPSSSSKPTGEKPSTSRSKRGRNNPTGGDAGLQSPKQSSRPKRDRNERKTKKSSAVEDDSEQHDISFRVERLASQKSDKKAPKVNDTMGESESDLGSAMSNLSFARRVPDRRLKQEEKEMDDASDMGSVLSHLSYARKIPDRRQKEQKDMDDDASDMGSVMSNLSFARKMPDRRRKQEEQEMDDASDMGSVMSNLSYSRKMPDRRRKEEKEMDDASDMGSVMSNLSYARKMPDRRRKHEEQEMDDASDMGSVMSNLSFARKMPDRRRKEEEKEKVKESKPSRKAPKKPKDKLKESKAVKIQALARGYIQRFLYKSMMAMENSKKKYASITIQAYARGYLQRLRGPKVSRIHVTPRREPMPERPAKVDREAQANNQKVRDKKSKKNSELHGDKMNSNLKPKQQKAIRKPVRHRSGSEDESFPRQLTIRKPRRQISGEESHELPVKQLTIRQPRRQRDNSDGSDDLPPKRATVRSKNRGRAGEGNAAFSPPRKVMLRNKKHRKHDGDLNESEASLDAEEAAPNRRDRRTSITDSKLGESVSDVGSLISELSNARKVPDRRRIGRELGGPRARGGAKGVDASGKPGNEAARTKSAIKIQSIGRGYAARFAFKSRMIMEQTKKKYFAIQIQAFARGFLARSKLKK